jgi:hypothetical protein
LSQGVAPAGIRPADLKQAAGVRPAETASLSTTAVPEGTAAVEGGEGAAFAGGI